MQGTRVTFNMITILACLMLVSSIRIFWSMTTSTFYLNCNEITLGQNGASSATHPIPYNPHNLTENDLAERKAMLDNLFQNYSQLLTEQQSYLDLMIKNVSLAHGIHEAYLDLFVKSREKANQVWPTIQFKGQRGVFIGPVAGQFNHCLKALRNARRIRAILPRNDTVKIAIMLSSEFKLILENCTNVATDQMQDADPIQDACQMWNGGTLFDDILVIEDDLPYHVDETHAEVHDIGYSAPYWMQALSGYLYAPYVETLFLDSDAYPCPGFEKIFSVLKPFTKKLWTLPSTKVVDLAVGIDQCAHAAAYDGGEPFWCPGDPKILKDFVHFAERNTGTVLFNFQSSLSHHFAQFVPMVAEHVYNNVATPEIKVVNDQAPFRIALYVFRRLAPDFNEQTLPMHTSCRTYAGWFGANIDGDTNGMFPRLKDGERCRSCFCTPCLISHGTDIPVEGSMFGWEPGFTFSYNDSAYNG